MLKELKGEAGLEGQAGAAVLTTPICGDSVGWHPWEVSRAGHRSPVAQRCEQIQAEAIPLSSGKHQPWKGTAGQEGKRGRGISGFKTVSSPSLNSWGQTDWRKQGAWNKLDKEEASNHLLHGWALSKLLFCPNLG